MEFGLFCGGYVPEAMRRGDPQAEHTRLMSELALCEAADAANWKYYWMAEHHFLDEYSHISSSEALFGYLAGRTSRIHLGSGIFNISPPVNHPVRIAERVAMLDHVTEGRFEFGTGRGSSTTEMGGFGIEDPEETRAMYAEVIGEFKRMWQEGEYAFDGEYFTVPPRHIIPKPYVKPHPPMWVAAGNPGTFRAAGRQGLGVLCFTTASPAELAPLIAGYKEEVAHATPVGEYVNDSVAVVSQFLCTETHEEAVGWMERSGVGYLTSQVFRYLDTFPRPPGLPVWPELFPEPNPGEGELWIKGTTSCVGTPEECLEAAAGFEEIGADVVLMGPSTTMWPHEVVRDAITLFGEEVIPKLDTDPTTTRTARFRAEAAAGVTAG